MKLATPVFCGFTLLLALESPLHADDKSQTPASGWLVEKPQGVGALKPWAIPDPANTQASWVLDPMFRGRGFSELVDSLVSVRWGAEWRDGSPFDHPVRDCREFRAFEYESLTDGQQNWVFACKSPMAGGTWENFSYFTGRRTQPTLERVRWKFDFAPGIPESTSSSLLHVLADSLSRRFGRAVKKEEALRDFPSWYGWREAVVYETRAGLMRAYLIQYGDPLREDLIVEKFSPSLWREITDPIADFETGFGGSPGGEVGRTPIVRRELALALDASRPQLARALRRKVPTPDDLPHVESALDDARHGELGGASADVAVLAAHRWLTWSYENAESESTWTRIMRRMERHGVEMATWQGDEAEKFYCNSLLEPLARRAGSNPWTDEAFAEWLERGAPTGCDCRDDAAQVVIEQGEAFLHVHPTSPAFAAVERAVAEAHEALWSMSKGSADAYWDPWSLRLEAPAHRERAIAMYRDAVRRAPAGWNLDRMRRRLLRMEIDVDTAQRAFLCGPGD